MNPHSVFRCLCCAVFLVLRHAERIRNPRTCVFKMADEQMKNLLRSLGLITFCPKFQDQRVNFNVILSAGDQDLISLGVSAIGDRLRLRDACGRIAYNCTTPPSLAAVLPIMSLIMIQVEVVFEPSSELHTYPSRCFRGRSVQTFKKNKMRSLPTP